MNNHRLLAAFFLIGFALGFIAIVFASLFGLVELTLATTVFTGAFFGFVGFVAAYVKGLATTSGQNSDQQVVDMPETSVLGTADDWYETIRIKQERY